MITKIIAAGIIFLFVSILGCDKTKNEYSDDSKNVWQTRLDSAISAFGHRNWIIIADAAYPKQSSSGIQTIVTGEKHTDVLEYVLKQVEQAPHIYPTVYLDAELKFVKESDSKGIAAYQNEIQDILKDKESRYLPHEEIIAKLDKTAKMFDILILKTNQTIPYTTVFLELGCGYWDSEKEGKLREEINKSLKQ